MSASATLIGRSSSQRLPLAALRRRRGPAESAAVGLSRLGTRGLVWVALSPLVAMAAGRRVLPTAAVAAAATWSADLLALGLREIVGRPRPCNRFSRTSVPCPTTPSFPSDHAAMAAAGSAILCRLEPRATPLLLPLAAGIACSRVRLGVHHATDVAAGAALGAGCALGVDALSRKLVPRKGGSAEGNELSELTKEQLYRRAQEADLPGRSQMSKGELVEALDAADAT